MIDDELPMAEYDKPGWVAHVIIAVMAFGLAVISIVYADRTGFGRWLLPSYWVMFAGYFFTRSRRLWRDKQARDAALRRWESERGY